MRSEEKTDRIQQVGDVFTMNMEGDHMGGEYQTDNHVTGYDENKLLAWKTAPAGTEPPGWQWVWELDARGLGLHPSSGSPTTGTRVTDQDLLKKVGFPLVTEDQLEDSLVKLDELATGADACTADRGPGLASVQP